MMVHLGNISFELYIVHQVLITLFASPARKTGERIREHRDGLAFRDCRG